MFTFDHPQTGEKIKVANKDFSDPLSWDEAKKACSSLGANWRLPTKDELIEMYRHKDEIGGFEDMSYWSSNEKDNLNAWGIYFTDGNSFYDEKDGKGCVRAVQNL